MTTVEENKTTSNIYSESNFSDYLINGKFLLTALEFHYELLERGISCSILEDFFSNPENFYKLELTQSDVLSINSHVSISTLDSADLRTGSEDQNSLEEQLKVYEFELRKKNEEIKSLKDRLTSATIGAAQGLEPIAPPTPTNFECETFCKTADPASNTESRALRFLINEHLLNNGYRMSAVQFAEECEVDDQQDLDDWDDVGLTCDRPPDLLTLLRASWLLPRNITSPRHHPLGQRVSRTNRSSVPSTPSVSTRNGFMADEETQTDLSAETLVEELEASKTALSALKCTFEATKAELEVSSDLAKARQQIGEFRGKVARIEAENLSLVQESTYWRNQLLCLKREYPLLVGTTVKTSSRNSNQALTQSVSKQEDSVSDEMEKLVEDNNREEAMTSPVKRSTTPTIDPTNAESTAAFRKLVINQPLFTRRCAPEFVRCASELLPPMETESGIPLEACRLADTLDEIIITIGSQIEDILEHLPDERKAATRINECCFLNEETLALPLLVQAICLHPDGDVRDKLLRTLFNLFTNSSEAETSKVEMKRTVTILRQCQDLATCLGPSRIESELLPQIWSQLNERPSTCLRKLLLSACGVIAPATPSRLRSSLLLSILLQSLEDEHNEGVRAVALRSLAGVVVLMEDRDKLPNLVSIFDTTLRSDWSHAPIASAPLPCLCSQSGVDAYVVSCISALNASCNWLLPTIAQWCLEVENLNSLFLDQWLEKLKSLCFTVSTSNSRLKTSGTQEIPLRLKTDFMLDELYRIMTVLNRLVPFVYVSILQSLAFINPNNEDGDELTLDDVQRASGDESEEEKPGQELDGNKFTSDCEGRNKRVAVKESKRAETLSDDHLRPLRCFDRHAKRRYEQLLNSFDHLLSGDTATQKRSRKRKSPKPNSSGEEEEDEKSTEAEGDLELSEPVTTSLPELKEEWPAMDELRYQHLFCIAQMMRAISPRPNSSSSIEPTDNTATHEYLEQDPISPQEFVDLMKIHFEKNYCAPWGLLSTSPVLSLCRELCFYVALYGKTFGAAAVQSYLGEPFQTLLMERSTQGYFEFNLKALPSGVFAGYCCLLAATKSKSEFNKVKMLIANAIFLHSRDSCSLHGVRAAVMALCHSEDAVLIAHEVTLPALRSCASCADPAVRRTASNIFYTLITYLADAIDFDATSTITNTNVTSNELAPPPPLSKQQDKRLSWIPATSELLGECWQLANQLARDDYTSIGAMGLPDTISGANAELPPIDEHSADWSCIAVALGPLFCLYSRMLRSSPHVTDSDLKERQNLSENSRIADQSVNILKSSYEKQEFLKR
ncbi:hypothetical protein ACTXT7_001223 [Hymenolepis weldensis]